MGHCQAKVDFITCLGSCKKGVGTKPFCLGLYLSSIIYELCDLGHENLISSCLSFSKCKIGTALHKAIVRTE